MIIVWMHFFADGLETGIHQQEAEECEYPSESFHQHDAGKYKDGPQYDSTHDAECENLRFMKNTTFVFFVVVMNTGRLSVRLNLTHTSSKRHMIPCVDIAPGF
jgi:hypothetical protein